MKISPEKRYKRYIKKGAEYYGISEKCFQIALFQTFECFILYSEVEEFVIPILEMNLNKKYQK